MKIIKFLLMTVLLCGVMACKQDEDSGSPAINPDSEEKAEISPEEKARLAAEEQQSKAEISPEEKARLAAEEQQSIAQAQHEPAPVSPSFSGICDRTEQVKKAILTKLKKEDCSKVTRAELKAISKIDLAHNKIQTLKAGDFEGLTSLLRLYLNKNKLTSLSAGSFQGLTSLESLFLSNNKLTSLPAGSFQGLTSLRWLSLYNNKFSDEVKDQIKITLSEGLHLTL